MLCTAVNTDYTSRRCGVCTQSRRASSASIDTLLATLTSPPAQAPPVAAAPAPAVKPAPVYAAHVAKACCDARSASAGSKPGAAAKYGLSDLRGTKAVFTVWRLHRRSHVTSRP